MKRHLFSLALALFATSSPSFAATKIAGSMKFLAPGTNREVSSVRVGRSVNVAISVRDLNLIANKDVSLSYALSVLPKGSNTPTTISGKFSGKFTLPASEGGATKTKQEMADLAGTESTSGILTLPEFMPAGVATVTITLTTKQAGSININKKLNITL